MQNTVADISDRQTDDETSVRNLIDQWTEAARKGRIDEIMTLYTPEVLAFDAIAALQFKGVEDYRMHWEMCLSHMQPGSEMIFEVHELGVSVSGDIAFAHYLSRCGGTDEQGVEHLGWMRATVCCQKTREGWKIAHEHYSMPINPETNQALSELTP